MWQTFTSIQPPRAGILCAWTNAFSLARDEEERQEVHTHFARVKIKAGRLAEAKGHLNAVTNDMYADLKQRLTRVLSETEINALTNNTPAPTNALARPTTK